MVPLRLCQSERVITEEYERVDFGKLVLFGDNCGGQNKNMTIMLSSLAELHSKRLHEVTCFYLISGYSYMATETSITFKRMLGNLQISMTSKGTVS